MKGTLSNIFGQERDMEVFIGKLLRWGVMLSCAITLLGGVIYIFQHHGTLPDYKVVPEGETFHGVASYLREFPSILGAATHWDGAAIIQIGVCVLIATPILRIAFSIFGFLFERDYMYVAITLGVFLIIVANMVFGLH